MPQNRKSNNYDALGSIFDFIFKESKKPPDKRRPVTASGISAEGALADALVATLERPGAFISDTIISEFNDALDVKLAQVDFGESGRLSISSGNIVDLIRDPGGFVDKAIQRGKAQRKASRARFLGDIMDDFLTTAWANKYGNQEAKEIALANVAANEKMETYRVSRAMGESMRTPTFSSDSSSRLSNSDYMFARSADLIGRKTFGDSWNTMPKQEKDRFINIISGGENVVSELPKLSKTDLKSNAIFGKWDSTPQISDIQKYLEQQYGKTEALNFAQAIQSKASDKQFSLAEKDVNFYKSLEKEYLSKRITDLKGAVPGSPEEKQRKIYEKSLLFTNLKTNLQIKDLKEELAKTSDPSRQAVLKQAIDDGETALRLVGGRHELIARVGELEGYLNSINAVWGGLAGAPNLVPSILNGDFFDSRKYGRWTPVEEQKVGGVSIYRAKLSAGKGSSIKNVYNQMGESLYYLTPRSIIRTFFYNGEGFARLLAKNIDAFGSIAGLSNAGFTTDSLMEGFNKFAGKDLNKFINDTLATVKASGKLSPADLEKFEKMLNSSGTLKRLTHTFSGISRLKEGLDGLVKVRMRRFRARFSKMLLQNKKLRDWLIKTGVTKLLGQWIKEGGVSLLAKTIVTAILGIAGQVLSPIGSLIVAALTWVATDLIFKILKFFLEFTKLILLGMIAAVIIIGGIAFGSLRKFNNRSFSYNYVAPGKVISCNAYGLGSTAPNPNNPSNPIIPPPTGETCIFGQETLYCIQGWRGNSCFSHGRMKVLMPVDLTNISFIFAPQFCNNPGAECKIVSYSPLYCTGIYAGGDLRFSAFDGTTTYLFRFLHTKMVDGYGVGSVVDAGVPIAWVEDGLTTHQCWDGKHLHLEVKQNGASVDPLLLLQSFNCNVPSTCIGCE